MNKNLILQTPFQTDTENPTAAQIAVSLNALPGVDMDILLDHGDFVILDKIGAAHEGVSFSYLQARPHRKPNYEGIFLVEYRDGVAGRHYRGYLEAPIVAAVFISYLRDDNAWQEMLVWRDVSFEFEELRAGLPPTELTASFFSQDEWEQTQAAQAQRDKEFWAKWETGAEP